MANLFHSSYIYWQKAERYSGWRRGQKAPPSPISFPSVTSAKVGISPQNFLTFIFDPFAKFYIRTSLIVPVLNC